MQPIEGASPKSRLLQKNHNQHVPVVTIFLNGEHLDCSSCRYNSSAIPSEARMPLAQAAVIPLLVPAPSPAKKIPSTT